ncbi:MAG: DUF4176 domain-containing protein [Lachnospiraceae bacterium]
MEKIEKMITLGSIVILKGGVKKVLIIGRGVATNTMQKLTYYDYVGCTYPEGILGDTVLYINQDNIDEIVFEGYTDEDNERMEKNIIEHKKRLTER